MRISPAGPRQARSEFALTGGENALDELLAGHLSILVLVDAAEEVHDARLLVVHPAHVALPPHVEVKVGELLQLWITVNVNADVLKSAQTSIESASTSSSLSMASFSFLLRSRASSHTCCHLATRRLTWGFLVSMGACVAEAYMVCVGDRFPVNERQTLEIRKSG